MRNQHETEFEPRKKLEESEEKRERGCTELLAEICGQGWSLKNAWWRGNKRTSE